MNRRVIFLSAFAAVLTMSLVAYGQQRSGQRGPGGRGMGSAMLLRAEAVQKELGVTAEQLTKLKDVLEAGRGAGGGQRNFQDMSEEERTKAREERAKQVAEQDKKIGEILKPEQVARLKQLRLQASGAMAFTNEELAKELKITKEQTDKIEKVMQEMRDAMQGGGGGAGGFAEMREKMNAKVMEILTAEQKTEYKKMLGKPFDLSQLRMGGPRGGN